MRRPLPLLEFLRNAAEDSRYALELETTGTLDADTKQAVALTLTNTALRLKRDLPRVRTADGKSKRL